MADPNFRALCAELLAALECEGYAHWTTTPDQDELCLRARAALAEADAQAATDSPTSNLAAIRSSFAGRTIALGTRFSSVDIFGTIFTPKNGPAVPEGKKPTRDELWELWLRLNNELPDRPAAVAAFWEHAQINARARAALADEPAVPVVVGPEWQPCVKLPITVHVREQRPGERHVSTREGITPVRPDDLIMRGVAGEEYPIGRELFHRTYRMGSADEPAVPEGREPAAVVGRPSDETCWQWYTYCPEEGLEMYSDRKQAQSAAQSIMGSYEVAAYSDGWHEDMESVSWGMLVPVEQAQVVARKTAEPDSGFDEWVKYELRAVLWGNQFPDARKMVSQPAPPASVTGEPSDEELIAAADAAGLCYPQCWDFDAQPERLEHLRAFARAVLARWGNPAPVPPADGEVAELVEALKGIAYWRRHGKPGADKTTSFDIRQADRLTRAADLLERLASPACMVLKPSPELIEALEDGPPGRVEPLLEWLHPTPVPVSERPWEREGWCDTDGLCWLGNNALDGCTPTWLYGPPAWAERFPYFHRVLLPAHALPVPEVGE